MALVALGCDGSGPPDPEAARDAWVASLNDWTVARETLRLRLSPPERLSGEEAAIWREDLPGLRSVLVCDHPEWTRTVTREQADHWQQSDAVLFATALLNQRAEPAPPPEALDLGDGVVLQAFEGPSAYVASNALCLEALPGISGPHGTLYAVPVRTLLVALPVEGLGVLQALDKLAQIVPSLQHEDPSRVSPDLYWRDAQGAHHRIAVTQGDDGVAVTPPPAFVDLLNRLAAATPR